LRFNRKILYDLGFGTIVYANENMELKFEAASSFHENLAAVKVNGKVGLIMY